MGVTNEFERDLNDTSFLRRPGRIDFRVFQNTLDAGDGHPGMQKCFRNYLHEGGMEKDLDVNSFDVKNVIDIELTGEIIFPSATMHSSGTQIHIHPNTGNADGNLILHPNGTNTASLLYLRTSATANYGSFTIKVDGTTASLVSEAGGSGTPPDTLNINDADWDNINIGDSSCSVAISGVTLSGGNINLGGNIVITGTVDGINLSNWLNQSVQTGASPTFVGLTLSAALVTTSTVDGVNISTFKTDYDSKINQSVQTGASPTFVGLTLSADLVTGSTVDGVNISTFKTDYDSKINQSVQTGASPTFVGLTLSADLVTGSTVDGVDVSAHTHGGAGQGGTVDHVSLSNKGSNTHAQIDSHISAGNPHGITLDKAFDGGKVINGAIGSANAVKIGDGSYSVDIYESINNLYIEANNQLSIYADNALSLRTINAQAINFGTSNTVRWYILSGGGLQPNGSNTHDIGTSNNEVKNIYACGTVQDTTCADLSHYTYEDLYNLFAQIKPMQDGSLHYTDTTKQAFPHIDFQTLPDEFGFRAEKDMVKNNMWEFNEGGEVVTKEYQIKKGDKIGIDAGTHQYALASLVVKMGEKIKTLEEEIMLLKNN